MKLILWTLTMMLAVTLWAGPKDFPKNVVPQGDNPKDGATAYDKTTKYKLFEVYEPVTFLQAWYLCQDMDGELAGVSSTDEKKTFDAMMKGKENQTWYRADHTTQKISGMDKKDWLQHAVKGKEKRKYFLIMWYEGMQMPKGKHKGKMYDDMLPDDDPHKQNKSSTPKKGK